MTTYAEANAAATNVVRYWRSTSQQTELIAINGNTLTTRDPLYIDFPRSLNPQVWRTVPRDTRRIPVGNRWSGIEHIGFSIGLGHSYRCVVRDSYVHHATDQNSGGQAYGIVIASGTSNSLIENNIARHHSKPIVSEASGGGNVIAHNAFTHRDLIEGNWTPNLGSGTTHGNSGWHTHFRNYASGINSSRAVTQNLRAVGMDGWTHFHAYVANVLGGGTAYEATPSNPSTGTPIYQLGRNPANCGFTCWDNGYSAAHIYRDVNWDNVTNAVVWASDARAIPPSLYLT